jgi:glycolate oxidase iron-sulfur subunit
MKARAILTGFMGLPPAKKVILRGMLARPQLFDHLMEWGAKFQKVLTKPANEVVGTSCARFTSPLLEDRHFKNLAQVPFHKEVASLDGPAGRSGLKVAFFVGCLLDKFFPTIPRAALKILQHHEVGVFIPPHQGCCGIPAASAGDMPTFRRLLQHNLDCFEAGDFDYLITACATCTATIKDIWPVMVRGEQGDLHERVNRLTTKTVDINEFLIDQLGLAFSPPSSTKSAAIVTYHDPCHLSKSLGVATQPRALLDSNPSYRFKQMAGADSCCGLGGSFNLQYYQISSQIGRLKRDNIVATGCDVVATGCPACMLQISDMLSKAGDAVQIKHPIEIYAETIN